MKNQANMPAHQSTPTTLAMATLRSLNIASGISGALTRDSMTRKAAKSTPATASRPSVCAESQPAWLPSMIA